MTWRDGLKKDPTICDRQAICEESWKAKHSALMQRGTRPTHGDSTARLGKRRHVVMTRWSTCQPTHPSRLRQGVTPRIDIRAGRNRAAYSSGGQIEEWIVLAIVIELLFRITGKQGKNPAERAGQMLGCAGSKNNDCTEWDGRENRRGRHLCVHGTCKRAGQKQRTGYCETRVRSQYLIYSSWLGHLQQRKGSEVPSQAGEFMPPTAASKKRTGMRDSNLRSREAGKLVVDFSCHSFCFAIY